MFINEIRISLPFFGTQAIGPVVVERASLLIKAEYVSFPVHTQVQE